MGLFKSKDERRIEREMKIKAGLRSIERSIRQQEKFSEDFIKNARHARQIGDQGQYAFIRSALKKTAAVKKMLEAPTARHEKRHAYPAAGLRIPGIRRLDEPHGQGNRPRFR